MITKTAMIALIGRPNVGKSTLVNALVGEKISIVTPKPQTTRDRIFGIAERGDAQLVFLDTPGFHKSKTRLEDYMVKTVEDSIADVDAAALVVEPKGEPGPQEKALIARLRASGVPAVLVVNKIDTVKKKDELLPVIAAYAGEFDFAAVVPVSARTGDGLDVLFGEFEKFAAEGPQLFPDDAATDRPESYLCAEILREKLLLCLQSEVPHGTAVEISRFSKREDGVTEIEATVFCEKESHKSIIIGKGGAMLKRIGEMARLDMEKLLDGKVYLTTWVKVKERWRDNESLLKNMGYTEE